MCCGRYIEVDLLIHYRSSDNPLVCSGRGACSAPVRQMTVVLHSFRIIAFAHNLPCGQVLLVTFQFAVVQQQHRHPFVAPAVFVQRQTLACATRQRSTEAAHANMLFAMELYVCFIVT